MHGFGDVRRAKVNHDATGRISPRNADPFVPEEFGDFVFYCFAPETEIDKARTGHGWWFAPFAYVQLFEDFCRNGSRILAPLFGENQRRVRLIITKAWISCRRDLAGIGEAGSLERF